MGNPNCCFMIIAVEFFFSRQSPRGTVKYININFVMKVLLCGDSLLCASSIARSKARLVPSRVLLRSLTFLNLTTPPVLLTMPIKMSDY